MLASFAALEQWLEAEREQLALWVPVPMGAGVAAWFFLPAPMAWLAFCSTMLALACAGMLLPSGARSRRALIAGGLLACLGCGLVWGKASLLGQAPLRNAQFLTVTGEVAGVRAMLAQAMVRAMVRPADAPGLPRLIRVNIDDAAIPAGLGKGSIIRFRVRLMPPAPPAVPGAYDFAARAYFDGIGATGRALPPIMVLRPSTASPSLRAALFGHVLGRLDGPAGGIAAALATGDQGGIPDEDADAMRRSGLAHLLSISGLHVTALIGAVMVLVLRLSALSRRAALDWPLLLLAAGGGALAGVGYTLLTGAEVPTIRSCIAALLVLGGLALGRDAITLRLVAVGAILVLLCWPETLVGPSFQMSFAAVTAIVALAEHPRFRTFAAARDEHPLRKAGRVLAVMLATGVVVELVLMPIALFHFHKAGMLGAFANLIAIPLTTFVIMPAEVLALLLDLVGLGAPAWWVAGTALDLLLRLAHGVAASPLASLLLPAMPSPLFATIMAGILWCLLWRTRWRWLGMVPVIGATVILLSLSPPDLLVTGDGRHVAIRTDRGMAILRERAGDYVRDTLSENAGFDGAMDSLATLPQARCSTDLCAVRMNRGGRSWHLLATRSAMMVDYSLLAPACARADIVIADRALPRWCRPRWLRIDRRLLARTGGIAIDLDNGAIRTVRTAGDAHPWTDRSPRRPSAQRLR
ncbi:competence protein ComEC [Sphingobium sp. OAS761]|nr:competence protein ComEC [Sphingobium sp. OAS761]